MAYQSQLLVRQCLDCVGKLPTGPKKSRRTGKALSKISGKPEKVKQATERGKKICGKLEKAKKSCRKLEKDPL